MDYSSFIDLNALSEDAKEELASFYEYLVFKYRKINKHKENKHKNLKKFSAIQLDTKGFKFNREEAYER